MRKIAGRLITVLISAACTAALAVAVLQETSPQQLLQLIRKTDLTLLSTYIGLSLAALLVRAVRYRVLYRAFLSRELNPTSIPWPDIVAITAIRNAMVDLVPARAGELLTIYFLKQVSIPIVTAGHSIVGLFLLDGTALAAIVVGFGLYSSAAGDSLMSAAGGETLSHFPILIIAALFGAATFAMFWKFDGLILFCIKTGRSILSRVPYFKRHPFLSGLLAPELISAGRGHESAGETPGVSPGGEFGSAALQRSIEDYRALRQSGKIFWLAALTIVLRVLKYSALYLLLLAVVVQWQIGAADIPFAPAFLAFVSAEAAATLPASGLLGFGAYEGTWALIFSYLGLKTLPIFSVIFAVHIITQVVALFLSVVGFAWIARKGAGKA